MSRYSIGPRDPQQPSETFDDYQKRVNGDHREFEGKYNRMFKYGVQGDAVDPDVDDYDFRDWWEERGR